ncbi:hypothetical protein HPP92_009182 [Vanilla planifolia]|uniref:Alpha/beta hydrolase fold-3 domain-containing protein n=1 Tax=Vanilla planifolia TaxID=51239 RepID=A0A835V6X1_VANPL|nr:hypothetical protein HPP92_009385 [Vanilla planifolia]KAG0487087.1 hypothetical protein HPP92_009182 [Vanilla planifolia]
MASVAVAPSTAPAAASGLAENIKIEILPFIRTYNSGRVERLFNTKLIPASVDPRTGVSSHDVTINPFTRLSARLYLPPTAVISPGPSKKLPIVMYFHGGGFCSFTAASAPYHNYLNSLASEGDVIAVSVDYRLAPEHPLPTAYGDAWEALLWLTNGCRGLDRLLKESGDFGRVFLAGDSAGANIAHNVGMRMGEKGMEVEGIALVHPFFWGKRAERRTTSAFRAEVFDVLWPFVCPESDGLDDPRVNPLADGAPSLAGLGCRRLLVSVAERDLFREKGVAYLNTLRGTGWGREAELFETKGKDHVFHVFRRPDEKTAELMLRLVEFFKDKNRQPERDGRSLL